MIKKITLVSSVALIATLVSACATPAVTVNSPGVIPQISVSGSGSVYVVPDIAYIYVGVRSDAATVAEALRDNNQLGQDIKATLLALGIDEKDVQTSSFSVYPQQYDQYGNPTETYYVVENTVYVTVRDLDKMPVILDLVAKTGANSINGIYFDVADKSDAMEQARILAVEDGRTQAEQVAAAAGVTLGKLINISLVSGGYSYIFEGKGGGGGSPSASAQVPISTGQLTISTDVTLVYELK